MLDFFPSGTVLESEFARHVGFPALFVRMVVKSAACVARKPEGYDGQSSLPPKYSIAT